MSIGREAEWLLKWFLILWILEVFAKQRTLALEALNLRVFLLKCVLISQMDLGDIGIKQAKYRALKWALLLVVLGFRFLLHKEFAN